MRRVYSNVQIGLISALLLMAIAFEASALQYVPGEDGLQSHTDIVAETR